MMKGSGSAIRRVLLPAFAAAAFLLGFTAAYRQDRGRVLEECSLARFHLLYALELKDDMGVIDWGKYLENMPDVRAFRATRISKVLAQGGNLDFLPAGPPAGLSYCFPDRWDYAWENRDPQNPVTLVWTGRTRPGPLQWGLLCLLCALLPSLSLLRREPFRARGAASPNGAFPAGTASAIPTPGLSSTRPQPFPSSAVPPADSRAFLSVARSGKIQRASAKAALLLGKDPAVLTGGHILDLDPDPSLLEAVGKSAEGLFIDPFLGKPGVSVRLQTEPEGILLLLEGDDGLHPPQKR